MEKIKQWLGANYLYLLMWTAFSAVVYFLVFPQCSADFINYDSSYQYFLTQHSMTEIFRLLPEDYSPPLYAVTLKLFTMLFGSSLYVMRVFNLGAIIGMLGLAAFPVRRAFGARTSVICSVLFACSAINLVQLHEIRPTYYSLFFFTAVGIYAYLAFFGGRKSDCILLTVYSVISMYTHNVAMLGALAVYITLLAFALITKDKKKFRSFFISGAVCALIYIPWLTVVFRQFGNVMENYWSTRINFRIITEWMLKSPFNYGSSIWNTLLKTAFGVLLISLVLKFVDIRKIHGMKRLTDVVKAPSDKTAYSKAAFMLSCAVLPSVILILFSVLVYPLASDRYFHIFSGCILMVLAAATGTAGIKLAPCMLCAVCAANFMSDTIKLHNSLYNPERENIKQMMLDIGEAPVFLHYHEWTIGIMSYYFPDSLHLICDDTFTVLRTYDVFTTDITDIGSASDISGYTTEFYIMDAPNMLSEKKTSLELAEKEFATAEYSTIGCYTVPYSYLGGFELIKVELD